MVVLTRCSGVMHWSPGGVDVEGDANGSGDEGDANAPAAARVAHAGCRAGGPG